MKNLLFLIIPLVLSFAACEEDDSEPDPTLPRVENVTFIKVTSGGENVVKVHFKLVIPDSGSVKSLSVLRGASRINNVVTAPESGTDSFIDHLVLWPTNGSIVYYTFIFIMQDDTEITSSQYKVQ